MEESTKPDYAIRINDYQYFLNNIQTSEFSYFLTLKIDTTEKDLIDTKNEIDESLSKAKSENLQMLGFFTAIISFTIGSINFIGDRSFLETALLILVLSGAQVLAIIGFGFLFQHKNTNNSWKVTIVSIIAFIVIIASFVIYYFLKLGGIQ